MNPTTFFCMLFLPFFIQLIGGYACLLVNIIVPVAIASLIYLYLSRKFPIFTYEFEEYPVAYPIPGRAPPRVHQIAPGHCHNCGSAVSGDICPKCGSVQKGGRY